MPEIPEQSLLQPGGPGEMGDADDMTLDQLMIKHQSDKASQFTRTWAKPHDYCRHLELFLEPIREMPVKILEIGCGGGESIRAWLEFFTHPETQVVSVDI